METREKEVRSIFYHAPLLTILQSALHHLWRPPSDSVDEYCHVLLVVTKQDPRLCNSPNLIGETPLHKLCLKGDRPTVAAFLKCTAANVNAANHLGEVRHHLSHPCLSLKLMSLIRADAAVLRSEDRQEGARCSVAATRRRSQYALRNA